MNFAIQILNFNNYHVTIKAIEAIRDNHYYDLDIFILDNGSSNQSYKELKKYINLNKLTDTISLNYSKTNLGFSGGHNHIYKWVKSESSRKYQFHLILNSDAFIPKDFFLNFIKHYENENKHCPIYGFRIYDPNKVNDSSVIQSWNQWFGYARKHNKLPSSNSNIIWQYFPSGAALLLDQNYIKGFNLFENTLFFYGDELDLCLRLRRKGLDFKIIDDIKITHSFGQSTFNSNKKRNLFSEFYYQRSKLILMYKFYPKRVLFVRVTLLVIILWRFFQGYFLHIPLLLKLTFISMRELENLQFADLQYD